MISETLCDIGVVAGVWAIIWLLLDKNRSTATGPILLMCTGLLCLLAGGILI